MTYHPLPLNWMAGAEIICSTLPLHLGHLVMGASENLTIRSKRWWHLVHSYS